VVAPVATIQADVNGFRQGSRVPKLQDSQAPAVTIESDRIERIDKDVVIFVGNVVARQHNVLQYADRMKIYLDEKSHRILRATATGNVRITTHDCLKGTARRAEYDDLTQRVVLSGNARLWWDGNVVVRDEDVVIHLTQAPSGVTRECLPAGNEDLPPSHIGPPNPESPQLVVN
jgi:lipopolysaccharide transport protein LptA